MTPSEMGMDDGDGLSKPNVAIDMVLAQSALALFAIIGYSGGVHTTSVSSWKIQRTSACP